jgi:hypothetical protein
MKILKFGIMQVMSTEKSANEILTEFAAKTNREIVVSQQDYPKTTIRPRNFYKKQIIIKDRDDQTDLFCVVSGFQGF